MVAKSTITSAFGFEDPIGIGLGGVDVIGVGFLSTDPLQVTFVPHTCEA
jgi:hypothetical protein